jgi:hypothetical protein
MTVDAVGSAVAEYDAYFKKYGRTPLHAKAIKDMLDAEGLTSMLAIGINSIAHERHPNADMFFEYIDHLLTHVREPDKTNGAQTDFAGKARKTLAMVEAALPQALALLNALDAKLKARRVDWGSKAAEADAP